MPKVKINGKTKKFPYTKSGMKAAATAKRKAARTKRKKY
jgi:hypothetical protein